MGVRRMEVLKMEGGNLDGLALLAAGFRTDMYAFQGIINILDADAGKRELQEAVEAGHRIYGARQGVEYVGLMICRVVEPTVWVEALFVREDARRQGTASALFAQAEALARSFGEDMVYVQVHPTNQTMLRFLQSRGYSVLNLLELRKAVPTEKNWQGYRLDRIKLRSPQPISARRLAEAISGKPIPKKKKRKKKARQAEASFRDDGEFWESSDQFFMIAGYHDNGTPYGLTWEEALDEGLLTEAEIESRKDCVSGYDKSGSPALPYLEADDLPF